MKILWGFYCCLVVILATSACEKEIPTPASQGIMTLDDFGPLIFIGGENVEPKPNSNLSLAEFNAARDSTKNSGMICIKFDATSVLEDSDQDLNFEDYENRSILKINEQEIPNSEIVFVYDFFMTWRNYEYDLEREEYVPLIPNGIGPYYICWGVKLGIGTHTVEFSTQTTSGEIRSFSWSFTITE